MGGTAGLPYMGNCRNRLKYILAIRKFIASGAEVSDAMSVRQQTRLHKR